MNCIEYLPIRKTFSFLLTRIGISQHYALFHLRVYFWTVIRMKACRYQLLGGRRECETYGEEVWRKCKSLQINMYTDEIENTTKSSPIL